MSDKPFERVVIPYAPRPHQQYLHNQLQRFNVLVMHRRFGKTVLSINELIRKIILCNKPNPRGAYIAPTQVQARKIAWTYLKQFTETIPGVEFNNSTLTCKLPGGREISLHGAENYHALRGLYLDYAILDEFAQCPPEAWGQVIRPALADRTGGAIIISTPFGTMNSFYDLYQEALERDGWYRALFKASQTKIIPDAELKAMRAEMNEEDYMAELECSWSAGIRGAYYARQMAQMDDEQRITHVPYDENYPVHTSWDLGMRDSTIVVYWQRIGAQDRIINAEAFKFTSLPDVIKQVHSHGYYFGNHIAPHDIAVHEFGSGQQRIEVAANHGIHFDICPRHSISDGINAVRTGLKRVVIDETNNKELIAALRSYRTKYDELNRVYSLSPLHDWSSDYADAVRMWFMSDIDPVFATKHDYSQLDMGRF